MKRTQKEQKSFDARRNYEETRDQIGYVNRKEASQADYDRIGFMSGLEVHQQLKTDEKLFCRCPSGHFHSNEDFDAEIIRHMRPTLSELGEYDGTALMEFKTRKEIIYRINNKTACTYEVDDTPPFPINRQALDISILISMLSRLNIVGEVHITRKQYLDGSIPTGFQRTAIIGVEGELPMRKKKIRLIQLSIEEDSCREISDIAHTRVYKTDRLGMPLIETVTYPDMVNPDEVMEVCDYIRFLNRSTGLVRTGMGAGRQDVNVSCRGGHRVEIKGVAHTKWIPELTHVEAFRQWALLNLRTRLQERVKKEDWKMESRKLNFYEFKFDYEPLREAAAQKHKIYAVKLPCFRGLLSHFDQPGKVFADEISDRLKVIACIEKPNMTHSEALEPVVSADDFARISELMECGKNDAVLLFWAPEDDVKTALEVIEERCLMAFEGIPPETRKSFEDGTTIFERVLPGADRMYPDTDSAPIPLDEAHIEELRKQLPDDVVDRYQQLQDWGVTEDTFTYIFSRNLYPLIKRMVDELEIEPKLAATFLAQRFKYVEGHYGKTEGFDYERIYDLFAFLKEEKLDYALAANMLPHILQHPSMDFESILTIMKFKRVSRDEIISKIEFLHQKFNEIHLHDTESNRRQWIMGQLRITALGNISMPELSEIVGSKN